MGSTVAHIDQPSVHVPRQVHLQPWFHSVSWERITAISREVANCHSNDEAERTSRQEERQPHAAQGWLCSDDVGSLQPLHSPKRSVAPGSLQALPHEASRPQRC